VSPAQGKLLAYGFASLLQAGHRGVTWAHHVPGDLMTRSHRSGWAWRDVLREHCRRCVTGERRDGGRGESTPRRHAFVMAGGDDERWRSVTRRLTGVAMPRQYCAFRPGLSLVQETIERLAPVCSYDQLTVVVDRHEGRRAAGQLKDYRGIDVFDQPTDCGTAIGLLVPLLELVMTDPDAVVLVTSVDQGVADTATFRRTVDRALEAAVERERIVLVGTRSAGTGEAQGWIVPHRPLHPSGSFVPVARLVHRAGADTAAALRRAGGMRSTMVMAAPGRLLIDLYERLCPQVLQLFLFCACLPAAERRAFVDEAFDGLGQLDLFGDLLAMAEQLVACRLPAATGWTDLGNEAALERYLAAQHAAQRRHPPQPSVTGSVTLSRRARRSAPSPIAADL